MLREAVEALARPGVAFADVLEAHYLGEREPTVKEAHALGVLEGAGVVLGLTARELLEAIGVMPPDPDEEVVSPAPAARRPRTARRATARRGAR